jgi:MFS family permease
MRRWDDGLAVLDSHPGGGTMMDQPIAAGAEDERYPAARYSWYVVGVLTAAYTISFIDRQILALMVGPIKKDLAISDTQMSLLIGLAFALFYTLLGLPIARIADRFNRRTLIAGGVVVWCAMTACCGLARNYAQLFLARIGVGVGEAVLSPSALSMLSDYFPPRTRGRAIAVYSTGITLGTGLAMILGGELLEYVLAAEPVRLPFFGELYAWQTVFLVVGLIQVIAYPLTDGRGLTPYDPNFDEAMKAFGETRRTYRNALRALAK